VAYTFLDSLSKYFELFLIILINEDDKQDKILEEFHDVIEDKIVLKHVKSFLLTILI